MNGHVDPRTRSKVSLTPVPFTSSISPSLLTRFVLSNLFLVFSLTAGKEWILDAHVSPLWLTVRVLGCGSMGALAWAATGGEPLKTIEWSTLGLTSVLMMVQHIALYTMLQRLSALRAVILIQSSTFIFRSLSSPTFTRGPIVSALTLILAMLSSARFSLLDIPRILPAYIALFLHAFSTGALDTTLGQLESTVPMFSLTTGIAFLLSATFYGLGRGSSIISESPVLPMSSFLILPFITAAMLYSWPQTIRTMRTIATPSYHLSLSLSTTTIFGTILGYLAFHQQFSFADMTIAGLLLYGTIGTGTGGNASVSNSSLLTRYLKNVLRNPESRKIFYFLMLNLAYMVVQVVYGVITNSLGLISDAIHMAFDCMAIAMGLFASVAATWTPNEQFTYGYGRIETLSGFANGIFLLLISIFIVFEAIQRLLHPPEMNTSQLLLVSTLGLLVNLFGMFAMGGHHHGGHTHSHGNSHSHGNDNSAEEAEVHGHSHSSHNHTRTRSLAQLPSVSSPSRHQRSLSSFSGAPVDRIPQRTHRRNPSRPDDITFQYLPPSLGDSTLPTTPLTPGYRFGQDQHFAEHHHSHHVPNSHDHAHNPSAHEGHSHNMRGVFLHVLADTLGSVGVIISTLLIQFYGWTGFDPIASLMIALLIAASVVPLVIESGRILALDVGDKDPSIRQALNELSHIEGVASYSQPRFWPKNASSVIGSIHVQLEQPVDPPGFYSSANVDHVLERVDTLLRSGIQGLDELTIQVEGRETRLTDP